jgi:hypothetical protein
MKPETQTLVEKLKDISVRYSSMMVDSLKYTTDAQELDKRISEIYAQQDKDITFVLANYGVWFPENHFDEENMLFFYGFDRSSLGLHKQMLLYDIEKRSVERVEILGLAIDIDWITLGKRHFHGLSEILGDQKSGAQTVRNKAMFYNDGAAAHKDLVELRDMNNAHIVLLRDLGLQDFERTLDIDDVLIKYEKSFIVHEGAHLMFDYVMSHQAAQFMIENKRSLQYSDDSERFAILSQMALSDLPSYTLRNFLGGGYIHEQYQYAVSSIVTELVTHFHKNSNNHTYLISFIKKNEVYTPEDVFTLCDHLRADDIRQAANAILSNDYSRYFNNIRL